ncbi:hypothetical protein GCM10023187_05350 [Nibrella viscosa]|uniref:Uncharacterized protein n=2 Tax=Nibrella viscosa TaxID=1084524 RepID=A0ABP8JWG7_9BACT
MNFVNSSIVPAAGGKATVKKDKNKNFVIEVDIFNLAEPQKLTPSKGAYLVWMESTGNSVKKLGQIVSASGTFSKALKGSLRATTIAEPLRIFITAEDDVTIQYPVGQTVLTTQSRNYE